MVRDQNGGWILGFNRYLGNYSVFDAELCGILDGLTLLIDQGHDNVLIQTDNLEVAQAIQESFSDGSNSALIRRNHCLLSQIEHW
ncbi:hypothetical protein Goshw_015750, partial [Gossypium schwendimanii]|nr:hypothetical protein [Gossypium schwendimanii]